MAVYGLYLAKKTYCPTCGKEAWLLAPKNIDPIHEAFYICFTCEFVGQIGVGPLRCK